MNQNQAQHRKKPAKEKSGVSAAVIQSNYIPWIGYFAIMDSVDVFIVYECVQYTKNDWRNRNQFESVNGQRSWLTIPVRQFTSKQPFMETTVLNHQWPSKHLKTLQHLFAHKQGWYKLSKDVEALYKQAETLKYLYEINRLFLRWAKEVLNIKTQLIFLESYPDYPDPNERLISILTNFGASHYLSGPAAQGYIDLGKFYDAQIELEYVNYEQAIRTCFSNIGTIKNTSFLQLLLEGQYELKNY